MKRMVLSVLISAMAALLVATPVMAGEVETDAEKNDFTYIQVEENLSKDEIFTEDMETFGEVTESADSAAEEEDVISYIAESDAGSEAVTNGGANADGGVDADSETFSDDETDAVGGADAGDESNAGAGEDAEEAVGAGESADDYGIELFDVKQDLETAVINGFGQDSDTGDWYYYTDGKIDTARNDVIQGTVNGTSGWWYVVGGKVQFSYTGVANYANENGWWYIKGGKVDFSANTVAQNDYGWWYVVGGKVDFSYTGVANYSNPYGWWYIKNGKVDFSANTVAQNNYGWWYVVEGKVQFSYTGVANYSNSAGWWYIKEGKVDFSANTVAQNNYGWWYVIGGKVQFGYTGVANHSNSAGWWYIKDGKVDFSANTVAQNNYGWWYVVGGKVQFSYTGVANYSNSAGWWYIKEGKVDFSVNTIAKNDYGWWYVKDGKVDFSAGDYSFAANTSQIIDVQASGSTGKLTMYNKNGSAFTKVLSTSCYVGRNGITSNKSEGDGKTPAGVYTLGQAFGVASDPGSTRSYLKVNSNYYWVDDSTSKYYNQLVDVSKVSKDWSSAEHLIDYSSAYKYAIAIDYNTACTPYKGSAIFLHCSTGSSTSGCVAVSESYMIQILQSLKSDTRIYIH